MEIFGREESIKNKKKHIHNDINKFMSGKSYSDENFPVASFLMTKKIRKIVRIFYFFARMADDVADHKTLTKHQKIKILKSFDNAILKNKQSHNKVLQ